MNTVLSNEEINKISASELLEKLGVECAPVDVFSIVERLPVKIDDSFDFSEKLDLSGEIKLDRDRNPVIWINPIDSSNRKRFTMAHEIGHLVNDIIPNLARVGVDDEFHDGAMNLKRDGRQNPKEYAANEFAAQLLMPKKFILKEAKEIIKDFKKNKGEKAKLPISILIYELARKFIVSEKAMEVRLKRIGIG